MEEFTVQHHLMAQVCYHGMHVLTFQDPLLLNAVNEGNDSVIQMLIQMAVCNSATPYKEYVALISCSL